VPTTTSTVPRVPSLPGGPRTHSPARTAFSVVALEDPAELERYLPAWDNLAAAALEPNVFYESWMLLPALRSYGAGQSLTIVLVFAPPQSGSRGQPLLCGLFPLERGSRFMGIPIRVLSFWHYLHCYLQVPLIRAGYGMECLEALFNWLATDPRGATLLNCYRITGEGPFAHLLLEYLEEHPRHTLVTECYTRALLRPREGERYLATALSGDKRKKLRRAEERLRELGPVNYAVLTREEELDCWLADFLRLEATGWKGQQGTALNCTETDRRFFLDATRAAFQRRRLMLLALQVAGRPVAQQCNFLTPGGAFAFKVAYDAGYARYSPGVLLELENIRCVHARDDIPWMDSCTSAGPSIIKQLWLDRRTIQTVLVETGRPPGALVLASLPLLRWVQQRLGDCRRWFRGPKRASRGESS
jgi:CelD/BcsL family acetyltransferase involved in cellulose biosynthesis